MKAIVYASCGPPDVLQVKEVQTPTPKDDEVLLRVHAAAVTTTGCNLRSGDNFMRLVFGFRRPKRPILGTELAGEIAATGKDVQRFRADGALSKKPANVTYNKLPRFAREA